MLLEGLHIPLTTPFHPDGRLNPQKLAANVIRYSKSPAQGLIVLGASGEAGLLRDGERRTALAAVAEAASPEKVLLAGVSCDSVRNTVDLADEAARLRFDAVLVQPPSFLASAAKGGASARVYLQAVADRSSLPVILVNADSCPISPDLLVDLARHPNVIGMVEARSSAANSEVGQLLGAVGSVRREVTVTTVFAPVTARMLRHSVVEAAEPKTALVPATSLARNPAAAATAVALPPAATTAFKTRTKTVGFQIIAGGVGGFVEMLQSGAAAIAPAFSACAPQACYEVYAAWRDGDAALAAEKQHRILAAAELAESLGPGGRKAGCDFNGYFGGLPRLPYLPPSADERHELYRRMESIRT